MKPNKAIFILFIIIIIGCETKRDRQAAEDRVINEIVLINGGLLDRCQTGDLIRLISKCKPDVIAINFLYETLKTNNCDSSLLDAIKRGENVMLAKGIRDGHIVTSNPFFSERALSNAVTGLILNDEDIVESYLQVTGDNGIVVSTLPYLIAARYDKKRGNRMDGKFSVKRQPLALSHRQDEFEVINGITEIAKNCQKLQGKIVLVGYLGPGDENLLLVRPKESSVTKMYETVAIANVIVDLLKD